MNKNRFVCLALVLLMLPVLGAAVSAAQVDCDSVYCFSAGDFSPEEELTGICITDLPDAQAGTVMLGSRVICAGDILTSDQLAQLTFSPLLTDVDTQTTVSYLPIYANRVEQSATMTIAIRGKRNEAPVAQDFALETYKNLPNEGKLKVTDPEGQELTFTITRQPRRGSLELDHDGSFVYTPKKNKVGVDSFTYTATDPAGSVSREATVTIQILKPTDAPQYTDTAGLSCRFEAEWLKHTGLFTGEKLGGAQCFYPNETVSRGQFLAMVMELLEIPMEGGDYPVDAQDIPQWLKPYYTAAVRAGLTAGLPGEDTDSFCPGEPITGDAAAVILQNALDLPMAAQTAAPGVKTDVPTFAQTAMSTMNENGFSLTEEKLTRAQVAELLYQVSRLAHEAPGLTVYRIQK